MDYFSVGQTLSLLRNRQIDFGWYLFEELYFGDTKIEKQAVDIAATLGIAIDAEDERLEEFSDEKGQKSSEIGKYVPNYDRAIALLSKLCTQ